jgi:hypothetical protein
MENKIILLNSSEAFLINGESYLLMKCSPTMEIAPNL